MEDLPLFLNSFSIDFSPAEFELVKRSLPFDREGFIYLGHVVDWMRPPRSDSDTVDPGPGGKPTSTFQRWSRALGIGRSRTLPTSSDPDGSCSSQNNGSAQLSNGINV
jgi:hypothetical protein